MLDTTTKTRKRRAVMTAVQKFQASKLIYEHCHPVGEGMAEWEAGWSDERVHAEVNLSCLVNAVSSLRVQLVGKIRQANPTPVDVETQLRELQQRFDDLALWASSRPRDPFKL